MLNTSGSNFPRGMEETQKEIELAICLSGGHRFRVLAARASAL